MLVYCVECKKDVDAKLVTGRDVYPHREDLYKLSFYRCPNCGGFVGTHKDGSERPLGCIPSPELKKARIMVHNRMDKLWKSGKIRRGKLYSIISKEIGYDYHNGEAREVKECYRVLDIIDRIEVKLC